MILPRRDVTSACSILMQLLRYCKHPPIGGYRMYRFRRWHILPCGLVTLLLTTIAIAQSADAPQPNTAPTRNRINPLKAVPLPAWRKWLNEDAAYIITDDERTEFAKLKTDQQRD